MNDNLGSIAAGMGIVMVVLLFCLLAGMGSAYNAKHNIMQSCEMSGSVVIHDTAYSCELIKD